MKNKLPKIVVVLGPTASGKTDLGIFLAKKFNGEVVSADSRQVYKEMNIATAKPGGAWKDGVYLVDGVPHHLIDIIKPDEEFTLADYKKRADEIITGIIRRGKLPIVVGGTGLYVWSVTDNPDIPAVAPDKELRGRLEKLSLAEMAEMLVKKDPDSASDIDFKNPRRVLRALEVALAGKDSLVSQRKKQPPIYDVLQLGISIDRDKLYGRINDRVDWQVANGLEGEVKKLSEKYSWDLPSMSGIGYKQVGCYLRGEVSLAEAVEMIKKDTRHYAKRQMTWFKRDERIKWIRGIDCSAQAEKIVGEYIK